MRDLRTVRMVCTLGVYIARHALMLASSDPFNAAGQQTDWQQVGLQTPMITLGPEFIST